MEALQSDQEEQNCPLSANQHLSTAKPRPRPCFYYSPPYPTLSACAAPPLKKAKKQGEMPLLSLGLIIKM